MKRDPIKTAYKLTPQYKWQQLLAEESKWKRRETIANNKLTEVRAKKDAFVKEYLYGTQTQ